MTRSLPEKIKAWRNASALTQMDAARLAGVSQATLSRWETGQGIPEGCGASYLVAVGVLTDADLGAAMRARIGAAA